MRSRVDTIDIDKIRLRSGFSISEAMTCFRPDQHPPLQPAQFSFFVYLVQIFDLKSKCANIAYNLIVKYLSLNPPERVQTIIAVAISIAGLYFKHPDVSVPKLAAICNWSVTGKEIQDTQQAVITALANVLYHDQELLSQRIHICQHLVRLVSGSCHLLTPLNKCIKMLFIVSLNNPVLSTVDLKTSAIGIVHASLTLLTRKGLISPIVQRLVQVFQVDQGQVQRLARLLIEHALSSGKLLLFNQQVYERPKHRQKVKHARRGG